MTERDPSSNPTALSVYNNELFAGTLSYDGTAYSFHYASEYKGAPVSLTMPYRQAPYIYNTFPPFFDGLLPEGAQLEGLLRLQKIDRHNYMQQLAAIGNDLVGTITVQTPSNTQTTIHRGAL